MSDFENDILSRVSKFDQDIAESQRLEQEAQEAKKTREEEVKQICFAIAELLKNHQVPTFPVQPRVTRSKASDTGITNEQSGWILIETVQSLNAGDYTPYTYYGQVVLLTDGTLVETSSISMHANVIFEPFVPWLETREKILSDDLTRDAIASLIAGAGPIKVHLPDA